MRNLKALWMGFLLVAAIFCSFSGLEYWPFLSYPMFACKESSDKIFVGYFDNESQPQTYESPSYSFVDPFSLTETLSNLYQRSEMQKLKAWRERLEAAAAFQDRPLKLFRGHFTVEKSGKVRYRLDAEVDGRHEAF